MKLRLPQALAALAGSLLACTACAQEPAAGSGAVAGQIMSLVLGLALVLTVIAACTWLLKRVAPRAYGHTGVLRIVAGAAVGQRERVVVVEIGATWLVLGVAPGSVNTLHQMPGLLEPAGAARAVPAARHFSGWLKQVLEKRGER